MEIETDVRGLDLMLIRMRAIQESMREDIKDAVAQGSEAAHRHMVTWVPRDRGRLAGSIRQGPVRYSPGGPGGGGFYEADITAGEGVPYVNVVLEGSGIWGSHGHPITASNGNIRFKIRPEWRVTTGDKYMIFRPKGMGHLIRKKSVAGQQAQTFWIVGAQAAAQAIVEAKAAEIGHKRYL